jgi:Family of unknown function (DUF6529)
VAAARSSNHSLSFIASTAGAFTAKMLVLRAEVPRWVVPVLGGAVFTAVTALWLTSAVWFSPRRVSPSDSPADLTSAGV